MCMTAWHMWLPHGHEWISARIQLCTSRSGLSAKSSGQRHQTKLVRLLTFHFLPDTASLRENRECVYLRLLQVARLEISYDACICILPAYTAEPERTHKCPCSSPQKHVSDSKQSACCCKCDSKQRCCVLASATQNASTAMHVTSD